MSANVETTIETLLDSCCGPTASSRQRYVLREALRSLVRLAEAEQRIAMRRSVARILHGPPCMPGATSSYPRRQATRTPGRDDNAGLF